MPESLATAVRQGSGPAPDTRVLPGYRGAEAVWAEVLAGDRAATFFASHGWQSAWWRHYGRGRRLLLVLVSRAGRPAGIGPFMVGRSFGGTVVRFVGTGASDYHDLLVNERIASRREVVFAALDAVRGRFPAAVLDLEQVPERSGTVGLLAEWAATRDYELRRRPQEVCPYQRLPADLATLDAGLSQSTRRQDRKNLQALRRLGQVRLVASGLEREGMAGIVGSMAEIERAHPAARRRVNSWQGRHAAFLADVLAAAAAGGQLWLSGLSVGGTLVAYSVAFQQNNVLYGYLQGYRREYAQYGPGTLLLLHLQREAVRRGIHTLDYLRGAEAHKVRWQTGAELNHRLLLRPFAAGPVGWLAGLAHLAGTGWRDTLRDVPGLRRARDQARELWARGRLGRPG